MDAQEIIEQQQQAIAHLNGELADRNETIRQLQAELAKKEAHIATLDDLLDDAEKRSTRHFYVQERNERILGEMQASIGKMRRELKGAING